MKGLAFSIYKLNNGAFQTSFVNPVTKKRRRQKFGIEKDAKDFKAQVEREFLSKNHSYFLETYVIQMIEQHLKDHPESKFNERKNVFRSFIDEFRNFKMNELTRPALKNWFDKIQKENDYSERTLSSIKSQINWLFRPLIDDGLLEQSPLDKIKFRRIVAPRRPRIILSVEEVHQLLENAKNFSPDGLYPFLSTVAHTGVRRSEALRLTPSNIDFATKLIQIKTSKNGRERFIRMSPTIESILWTHIENHRCESLFICESGAKLNSNKELMRLVNKFKAFFPLDKGWGCHSLRHSFAYNFLKKGGEMYQLQAILGHRSIDVTVDVYGQLHAQDVACPSPYETVR
jgi:integrase/recombinase XerD